MIERPTLFDDDYQKYPDEEETLEEEVFEEETNETTAQIKFEEFHAKNPHVLEALLRLTDQIVSQGHKRIGIGLIWNQLRWESMINTTDIDYKLNSNYQPRYVRLIEEVRPDLIGLFEKRRLRT